ncbi:MAG: FAD-dependent oxidoreductase [Oscillatoriaceae cyanobacterium]
MTINGNSKPTAPLGEVQETTCCIVGGGPAGAVLGLLLGRQGIPVMLLEAHQDFDRDFRGDTLHPSVMEIMDDLGLAERLLQLHHSKIDKLRLTTSGETIPLVDLSYLKTKYPYITMMPQVQFLKFITAEAQQYPNFQLVMGANVQELVSEAGVVRGVRYRGEGGWHEVRALVTVAADGRFSRLRQLAGLEPVATSPPMDVVWFRLPRLPEDPADAAGSFRTSKGRILVILERETDWQFGYVIAKGTYPEERAAGLAVLRNAVAEMAPEFAARAQQLQSWHQVAFLSVESSCLKQWYLPGLLFIGDAAHVMSPVGGVGINYAIQDAVVAANVLAKPLQTGAVETAHLAAVQGQRLLPTRIIQGFQSLMQGQIIAKALKNSVPQESSPTEDRPFHPPGWLYLPGVRYWLARLLGFGVNSARIRH